MCGILGGVNIGYDEKVRHLISHRGPDFQDGSVFEVSGQQVQLDHCRLAIVDLSSTGNQPMSSEDDRFVIVFNGEIYNHEDLRKELPKQDFKGHSDTETIIYYLKAKGILSVAKLNGIFAFALLDKEKEKLYLVRDPFGVKPLYYWMEGKKLLFSSELRPLKFLLSGLKVNKKNLSSLLKLRYSPSPDTLYNSVFKIRPGHYITYDLNTHTLEETSFQKSVSIVKNRSFYKAVDKYGVLFEQAVNRQLMGDVETGLLLSGGLDSALVGYFAQKHTPYSIKTFTVGFEDDTIENELEDARETALFLQSDHREVKVSESNFKEVFEEVCRIVEEPLATTSILPMYYLNKEVGKHLKVVLTGQGADEPLGGYARYKGEKYRNYIPGFLWGWVKPLAGMTKKEKIIRALNAFGEKETISRFEKIYAVFTDSEIKKLLGEEDIQSRDRIQYMYDLINGSSKKTVEAMMSVDLRMNLADDLLLYTDKISMHYGIEARVPFLDHEMITFLETLPSEFRLGSGQGKRIHREFAKTVLPEDIIFRPKKGFQSPTKKWFRGDLGSEYYTMIEQDQSVFSEIFNKKEVLNIFNQHRKGENREKQIFILLSLYYWFQNNKDY